MKRILGILCTFMLSVVGGLLAAKADVVLDWNAIAINTAVANGANPFAQARYAAIVQLAVFEAVNSVTHKYKPYLGTITAQSDASPDAAAVEAAYQVLAYYFPASVAGTLYPAYTISIGAIPDGQAKTDGIAVGDAAAAAMIALRTGDGSSPMLTTPPGPPVPGVWQLTGKCTAGIAFNWQNVKPFGISSASDYLLAPPPALTSHAYTKAYNEVMTVGSATSTQRPADRANVVLYYAASSPTQVFNQAAEQVAAAQGRSLSNNARALALINMAISDSLVASFYNKYLYNFWRPVTAIQGGDSDGNPYTVGDPSWAPFIPTPCFPSYPSNHGSAGNAGAEVMARIYGDDGISITLSNPTVPTIVLNYTSVWQITADISDARVYGGIHFRTDQDAGVILGKAVGKAVYKNNLRPIGEDD